MSVGASGSADTDLAAEEIADDEVVMDPYMLMSLVDDEDPGSPTPKRSKKESALSVESEKAMESIRKRNESLLKVKEESAEASGSGCGTAAGVPGPTTPPRGPDDVMEDVVEEPEQPDDEWWDDRWWSWGSWWSSWRDHSQHRWRDDEWRDSGSGYGGGRGSKGSGYGRGGHGSKGRAKGGKAKGQPRHHGGKAGGHGQYTADGQHYIDSWGQLQPFLEFISLDF